MSEPNKNAPGRQRVSDGRGQQAGTRRPVPSRRPIRRPVNVDAAGRPAESSGAGNATRKRRHDDDSEGKSVEYRGTFKKRKTTAAREAASDGDDDEDDDDEEVILTPRPVDRDTGITKPKATKKTPSLDSYRPRFSHEHAAAPRRGAIPDLRSVEFVSERRASGKEKPLSAQPRVSQSGNPDDDSGDDDNDDDDDDYEDVNLSLRSIEPETRRRRPQLTRKWPAPHSDRPHFSHEHSALPRRGAVPDLRSVDFVSEKRAQTKEKPTSAKPRVRPSGNPDDDGDDDDDEDDDDDDNDDDGDSNGNAHRHSPGSDHGDDDGTAPFAPVFEQQGPEKIMEDEPYWEDDEGAVWPPLQPEDEHGLPPIQAHDISADFERGLPLDAGNADDLNDGGEGHIGGFNRGVFVVRRRRDALVCVEKRLRARDVYAGRHLHEIRLTQRVRHHPHCVGYVDAFALAGSVPPTATLYVPYYSCGSLNGVVTRQTDCCALHWRDTHFPEAFVWHVLRALAAALVHLRTGSMHATEVRPVAGWRPILHRDIKADNVFLRPAATAARAAAASSSSSKTAASASAAAVAYPVVALGDFGHAMIAPADADDAMLGATPLIRWAPEVPRHDVGGRSDVWSAGGVAKTTATLQQEFRTGIAKYDVYNDAQPAGARYSRQLNTALRVAMEPDVARRVDACALFARVNELYAEASPPLEPIVTECPQCIP